MRRIKTTSSRKSVVLPGFTAALMASAAFIPTSAHALPTCSSLATTLLTNPDITKATSAIVPAAGANSAYCNVQITVSDLAGPTYGYQSGQAQAIDIGIGLPLNSADGGSGSVQGAWNGRIEDLGGGGYAGTVGSTTSATNLGYVGSSTDTGHSAATQGFFALNPDDSLNWGLIRDFFYNGIHAQAVWSKKLTLMYYGMAQQYTYWNGCSTGGRQGHQQAQRYPSDYNGILAGSNAFNWDRFIPAEQWGEVVMNQELGYPILASKLTAVQEAAVTACQNNFGGTPDGIIQDPRTCLYDANAYVCGQPTAIGPNGQPDTTNCLTGAEATAINKIWNGPPSSNPAEPSWFGLERGTSFAFLDGTTPFSISTQWFQYWVDQNPGFDWHTLTESSFLQAFQQSEQMFHQVSGTDDPNLMQFAADGGKMITYHGLADPLIMSRGTFNYYNRVMAEMGGLAATQAFYRFFPYPSNNHCGSTDSNPNQPLVNGQNDIPLVNATDLFNALVNWVEKGQAPNSIIAYNNANEAVASVSRPICVYPNTLTYNGSGSIYSASSFTCATQTADQYANAETVIPDPGPKPVESIADTHDYNADHISDVLWRDTAGDVGIWLMNGHSILQTAVLGNVPTTYSVVGIRDFAGQGYSAIVWRDTAGDTSMWQMDGTTVQSTTSLPTSSLTPSPTNWSIVATGDFNADGMGDILWEDNNGNLLIWFMNGSQISSTQSLGKVPANWTIVGADMNGWIFLRNTVTGEVGIWLIDPANGTVAQTVDFGAVPMNWTIAGIGDFNHGGYSDILWRDNAGNVGMWILQPVAAGGGSVTIASTSVLGNVPLNWSIAQTGDFNGDLKADILWIDNTGNVGTWFMNGTTISSTIVYGNVGSAWSVQAMNSE